MAKTIKGWKRQGEAFWRTHHEAWKSSDLNQREYCEAHSTPLKSFGNWSDKFKAESQPVQRKLLYRRGGIRHTLRHSPSHTPDELLSHVSYPTSPLNVPPLRDGHRRRFAEAATQRSSDWRHIKALKSSLADPRGVETAGPVRSPRSDGGTTRNGPLLTRPRLFTVRLRPLHLVAQQLNE